MSHIATFNVTAAGGKPTFAAAAAADTTDVGDGVFLVVKNADGSPHTVTIAVPGTQAGGAANDPVVYTVAATTGEQWIRMHSYYADPTDGKAHLTWSATTSMTRAVVKA